MTGIEEGAAIAAVVGTAIQVGGSIDSASQKASAAKQDADLKDAQADELISREQINEGLIQDQSQINQKEYSAAFASSGREGSGIGGVLQLRSNTATTIANSQRDAQFKASMLRAGANISDNLASDEITAGYITGGGTLLTGATKIASAIGGGGQSSGQTKGLPTVSQATGD